MVSRLIILANVCLMALMGAPLSYAQETVDWPHFSVDEYYRGDGGYLSLFKLLIVVVLFICWVKTTDWVNQDAQIVHCKVHLWNPIVVGLFSAGFLLIWILPNFWLGISFLGLVYVGPLGAYIYYRNSQVEPADRVFTPDHLKGSLSFSRKTKQRPNVATAAPIPTDEVKAVDRGPALHLTAAESEMDGEHILAARRMPGYRAVRELLAHAIERHAEALMIDFLEEAAGVRYRIDGAWINIQAQKRRIADPMWEVLMTVGALDPEQTTFRQQGTFGIEVASGAMLCRITSEMKPTGLRVLLKLEPKQNPYLSLEQLGMHPKLVEQLGEILNSKNGLILFSSMPGGGLTTTVDTMLGKTDRFVRDFVALEEATQRERAIEGVEVRTYPTGESPASILLQVVRNGPDILVVRDLKDTESARFLCRQAMSDQLVISTIAAKSAAEALLRVMLLKVPGAELAPVVKGVLYQRLIRRLCDACKEPYQPTPDLRQKLGLPESRVKEFYRPGKTDGTPCSECRGIGYRGRTALFELLLPDDAIREGLVKNPNLDALRAAATNSGMHSIRDFGSVLIGRGTTSVEELVQVLKQ